MTYGETLLVAGSVLVAAGILVLFMGMIYYSVKKKKIRKKIYEKYGL